MTVLSEGLGSTRAKMLKAKLAFSRGFFMQSRSPALTTPPSVTINTLLAPAASKVEPTSLAVPAPRRIDVPNTWNEIDGLGVPMILSFRKIFCHKRHNAAELQPKNI